MADAEDLKSSGDFSSCGFDSHPGHQFFSKMSFAHLSVVSSPQTYRTPSTQRLRTRRVTQTLVGCRGLR